MVNLRSLARVLVGVLVLVLHAAMYWLILGCIDLCLVWVVLVAIGVLVGVCFVIDEFWFWYVLLILDVLFSLVGFALVLDVVLV